MEVGNSLNSYLNTYTKRDELTQEQRDFSADVVKRNSVQKQIDIYTETTKNANEQYDNSTDEQQNQSAAYVEFSQDVRRADNYQTFLDNGGEPSALEAFRDRPTTLPAQELTEQQRDTFRESAADIAKRNSVNAQIEAYRAGAQNAPDSGATAQESVQNYNEFAQQARRSEYINTYIQNS
jgi:hypothetical protein